MTGSGDNSLFIAKYTSCSVDAVDLCFDVLTWDSSPLAGRTYDVVLDSGLLHCLGPPARPAYLAALQRVLKPGGTLYVLALSDKETSPGGPSRVSREDLEGLLSPAAGWELQYVKPHFWELHPTFWGGKGRAYLAAAQRPAAAAPAAPAGQ
ncbi:hypothetical protein GPECTOR_65g223 [Gonium pectorale]|uniref:Methyltransferase type 11 domain-containing protein n=1 Tax=Gonium pectorale TaxID=33097 RepID=A0A150G4Z4_GONPE|nr:hypothetical protein GPECTOR_65g223 [Gonium pectorale]|eukprot:KXZ44605.1 hypothetical protein GPECTOR_65g223 [Gonium pectorale]